MAIDLRQNHFRFGRNTGAENTHAWLGNEDANISFPTGVTFLLRIVTQEEGGTGINNVDYTWQYNKNGAGWNNITTTSSVVKSVTNNCWSDGDNCTQRLTGSGTFESSGAGLTVDGTSGGGANDIAASGCSETEISLQLVHADVANADTIQFQVTSPDTTITNDVTPSLTVIKGTYAGWNYTPAGAISPAGVDHAIELPAKAAGVLSFAGSYIASKFWALVGVVTYEYTQAPSGNTYEESRDGGLTLAGAISRLAEKLRTYSSGLDFAGTAQRLSQNLFARTKEGAFSALALLGSAQRLSQNLFARTKDGVVEFVGDLSVLTVKLYDETREGVLEFAGAAQRLTQNLFSRTKAGALDLAGTAQRLSQNLFTRTKGSALTFAGAVDTLAQDLYQRTKNSAVTFAGTVSGAKYSFTPSVSGLISFAGRLIRETPLYGLLYRTLNLLRTKTSTISFSGAIEYIKAELDIGYPTGILNTVGSIAYDIIKAGVKGGTLTFHGAISRLFGLLRTTTGTLTTTGRAIRSNARVSHLYTGAIDLAGTVWRGVYQTYSGTLDFAGSVSRSAIESLYTTAGTLTLAGSALRNFIIAKTQSGVLTFSGLVSPIKTSLVDYFFGSASGTMDISGAVQRALNLVEVTVAGILTPIGRITLIDAVLDRITDASVTVTGSISHSLKTTRRTLSGVLDFAGRLSRKKIISRTKAGVLSFAGSVAAGLPSDWNYYIQSALSFAGAVTRLYDLLRTYTGLLIPTGILTHLKNMGRTYAGVLSFAGTVAGIFLSGTTRLGYLTPTSILTRLLVTARTALDSSITFAGTISPAYFFGRESLGSALTFGGNVEAYREALYYGPELG